MIIVSTVLGTEIRILNIATSQNYINAIGIDGVGGAQVTGFDGFGDDGFMHSNIRQIELLTSSITDTSVEL
jgi:hypothetical protein